VKVSNVKVSSVSNNRYSSASNKAARQEALPVLLQPREQAGAVQEISKDEHKTGCNGRFLFYIL
jgi:hypothetical protein